MQRSNLKVALSFGSAFVILTIIVIIAQILTATPVAAQTAGCIDPFTGAECTPTPVPPTCGIPGTPPCQSSSTSTPTVKYVRPTLTPTTTASPTPTATVTTTATLTGPSTSTPSVTATITLIPTSTHFPTPTPKPIIPVLGQIPKLISYFHPQEGLVAFLPPWLSPINIKLTDLEITQVTQCLHNPNCADNSVPLYTGKLTMVRAFVRLAAGPNNTVTNIGGALCYGISGVAGCANPLLPVNKITVSSSNDLVNYYRRYIETTLNFILPENFVSGLDPQKLTVYVNYNLQDQPGEVFYSDNYKTLQYQVTASEPIYIRFHPVQDSGFMPPIMEWANITSYLSKTYPTGEVYASLGVPLYGKNYAWADKGGGCPKGWSDLLEDLWYLRGGSGPIAYGEAPYQSLKGGVTGCGYIGWPEAAGIAGRADAGRTAAQEVGHTLGLGHVPGCGAKGSDLSYPNMSGLLDETGVDPATLIVYSPAMDYDFMGYCGGWSNTWTSLFTYKNIAGLLPSGNVALPSKQHLAALTRLNEQTQKVLVGSGDLSPTSASLTRGFYLLDKSSFNIITPDQGAYSVELQDTEGKVLYSQHFDLVQLSNDDPHTEGTFRLVLPWKEGTKFIIFKFQDQVIGQTAASNNAPTLALTSPGSGESWSASGQQTITWQASDVDNDLLSFMVQYSPDDGQTWKILAANLQDPSFTFDGDYLPGSEHGTIRVVASDGFNSTQVDSSPLVVAEKLPLVVISSPSEAASFDFGTPVIMQAIATDIQDGQITNEMFKWTSDKDGSLGNGSNLILSNLSEGAHLITISVQNSAGLESTVSIHITINTPVSPIITNTPALMDFLPLVLLCLIPIVAIVGLIMIFRRRKRMKKN